MSSNIRINRICEYCGLEFMARTSVTKYCQHRCASMAYKERTRRTKIEISNIETAAIVSIPIATIQAKEFLSVRDAAMLLGVSRWTIGRAIKQRRLRAVNVGARVVIKREEIEKMLQGNSFAGY